MYSFVAKYAAAAHLALLTVAPLFLSPFCEEGAIARAMLWLSLVCVVWIVMSPSVKEGEYPHDARVRFCLEIPRDPIFWMLLLLVLISGIRALNGGVGFVYDYETKTWSLAGPAVEIMPGCVDGAGFLPFAGCVAMFVIVLGLRHALDRKAALAFLVSSVFLAGVSAAVAVISLSYGNPGTILLHKCAYLTPSFIGGVYGIYIIGGVAALFCCTESRWVGAEMVSAVSLCATAIGFSFFSPVYTLLVFSVGILTMISVSFIAHGRTLAGISRICCGLAALLLIASVVAPFLCSDEGTILSARCEDILSLRLFPEGFAKTRALMSDIAFRSWKTQPWLGGGIGSFALDMRNVATPEDWRAIPAFLGHAHNGLWQFLAERGVVGVLMAVLTLGFIIWSYVAELLRTRSLNRLSSIHFAGPLVLAAVVAVAFVDNSFVRVDFLLAACAVFVLSAAVLPVSRTENSNN